ncbi:MAG: hypothetical protein R3326_01090 [Gemmatimonadota bacterium]|nr:hypothetical protein [Gemmatimonadota bacterium]
METFRLGLVPLVLATLLATATGARAQQPTPGDTTRPATADTTDQSLEAIEARLLGELGEADTTPGATARQATQTGSLNPDISLIADFLADFSPDESTIEGGDRFQLREIEIGVQGAVDPYFRYDAFLAIHGGEIEIEEAYATTLSLPARLQAKIGRFLLPFGKENLTHRPELNTVEYPLVIQEYFGEEGFSSTGIWGSIVGDPLGFVQEFSLVAANGAEVHAHGEEEDHAHEALAALGRVARLAHDPEDEHDDEHHDEHDDEHHDDEGHEDETDLFDDLGDRLYVAHLKNSIDLSEAANLEIGFSAGTSATEGPRTNLWGANAIWRWKPPARAKYRSAILQAEAFWRRDVSEEDARFGAFAFGQWQLTRRTYLGARFDYVEAIEAEEGETTAGQVLLRYFPTEFSQLRLAYERQEPEHGESIDRVLFQTTFALGPHRPHPY